MWEHRAAFTCLNKVLDQCVWGEGGTRRSKLVTTRTVIGLNRRGLYWVQSGLDTATSGAHCTLTCVLVGHAYSPNAYCDAPIQGNSRIGRSCTGKAGLYLDVCRLHGPPDRRQLVQVRGRTLVLCPPTHPAKYLELCATVRDTPVIPYRELVTRAVRGFVTSLAKPRVGL